MQSQPIPAVVLDDRRQQKERAKRFVAAARPRVRLYCNCHAIRHAAEGNTDCDLLEVLS